MAEAAVQRMVNVMARQITTQLKVAGAIGHNRLKDLLVKED